MKGKLTAAFCDKTTKPGRYNDGGGLYLLVKADGRKTWVFRFDDRVTKKQQDMGLGRYGKHDVTLAKARIEAGKQRQLLRQLKNPIDERRRKIQKAREALENTFKSCMQRYIEKNKAAWKNAKHTAQWTSTLETYAQPILDKPVADIEMEDVLKCLEPIWTTKTETATRVRQRIEKVMDTASGLNLRSGDNPAKWKGNLESQLPKPQKLKNVQHRPALDYKDIGQFMAELRDKDGLAPLALELQILTATRPSEVYGATWAEFDLDNPTISYVDGENQIRSGSTPGLWIIPAGRMKAGKEHVIPLSKRAAEIIKSLPRVVGNDYLFIGLKKGTHMTTAAGMKLVKELRPGKTAHGMRSTFRDWAAEQTNFQRLVIEHALAHQLPDKAEASYHRKTMLHKRKELMQAWSNYCAVIPSTSDNVSPIRGVK